MKITLTNASGSPFFILPPTLHHRRYITDATPPTLHNRRYTTDATSPTLHHRRYTTAVTSLKLHHRRHITDATPSTLHHRRYTTYATSPTLHHHATSPTPYHRSYENSSIDSIAKHFALPSCIQNHSLWHVIPPSYAGIAQSV